MFQGQLFCFVPLFESVVVCNIEAVILMVIKYFIEMVVEFFSSMESSGKNYVPLRNAVVTQWELYACI